MVVLPRKSIESSTDGGNGVILTTYSPLERASSADGP